MKKGRRMSNLKGSAGGGSKTTKKNGLVKEGERNLKAHSPPKNVAGEGFVSIGPCPRSEMWTWQMSR